MPGSFFMKNIDLEADFFSLLNKKSFKEAEALVLEQQQYLHSWEYGNFQGAIALVKGDAAAAESHFRAAASDPESGVGPSSNLVNLLTDQGRHGEALPYAEKAYKLTRSVKHTTAYLGVLLDQAKTEEALAVLHEAPDSFKSSRDGVLVRVACLRQSGKSGDALEVLGTYLAANPNDAAAVRMRADTVGERDSLRAIPIYEEAFRLAQQRKPQAKQHATRWNMSLHLLRTRDFRRGWDCYESGLQPDVGTLGRKLPVNVRSLNLLNHRSVLKLDRLTLLSAEQGIGDQVLFMSVLNEAIAEGNRFVFVCEPRMDPIIKRSFPAIETVSQGILEYFEHYSLPVNGFLPIGSLMGRYRPTLDSFVRQRKSFLVADRKKYEEFRRILNEKANGRPIVGISWKGGFWENQQRNKALDVQYWERIARGAGVVVNLQYGNVSDDLRFLRDAGLNVINFDQIDFKKDLDSWLALAGACDGIISVSTALVHFAGAIGQKVAVVMPEKQGPWILGITDKRSIVYPNVHIFRPNADESLEDLASAVSRIIQ